METPILVALISAGIGLISTVVALTIGLVNYFHNRRMLRESRIAERRKILDKALNEFYGPVYSYLSVVKALYRIFVTGKPEGFRTLTYLIHPEQQYDTPGGQVTITLSDSDRSILAEMVEIEKKIEELIVTKGGLIEDPELMFGWSINSDQTDIIPEKVEGLGLLAVAITHFRVLRMAFSGILKSEPDRYKAFVYPRELDEKLFHGIQRLQAELKHLAE